MELTNTTAINDDFTEEIISSLALMKLCSVAESCTCTRFRQMINRVFSKKYAISSWTMFSKISAHDIERCLQIFGSLISTFVIDDTSKKEDLPEATFLLDLITRYCTDTIKELRLIDLEIPEVLVVKLIPLFKQLKHLHLSKVTINCDGKELFANCESLVELDIVNFKNAADILVNIFPKLECFTYERKDNYEDEYVLAVFISRHKNSKRLSLQRYNSRAFTTSILQVIGDNCKELTELRIQITLENEKAFTSLQTLGQLKSLKIGLFEVRGGVPVTKFIKCLQLLKSLELLEVWNAVEDTEFVPALLQLKNLRKLNLVDFVEVNNLNALGDLIQLKELFIQQVRRTVKVEFNLVDIIKRLMHLEKLVILMNTFNLDNKTFSEIVRIVNGRPEILTLICKFDFQYSKNILNEKVILLKYK